MTRPTRRVCKNRGQKFIKTAGLLIPVALFGVGQNAHAGNAASDQILQFNIPAQSLSNALTRFSADTRLQVLYEGDVADKLQAPALNGTYTPAQALEKLLGGTGLKSRYTNDKTITIEAPTSQNQSNTPTLKAMTVTGKTGYTDNDPYNPDYNSTRASSATKTDTPIFDTPVSIQVVPRAVMDDQKNTRIADALENVSGVRAQPSLGAGMGFIIRGFSTSNVYRNGLLTNEGSFGDFDAGNLENVEVIKGPAQLYGRTEPGGLISLTTKKPLDTPYYSLEQQFGSYDLYRTQWDAGGPITSDKSLLYRFSGAYQNNNSFRDFVSVDRKSFNPSITWQPTDATDVTVNIEGTEKNAPADFGIPVIGNRPALIPISRNLGDPNTPLGYTSTVKVGSELNHRFNENWAIHNRFLASLASGGTTFVNPAPAFNAALALNQSTGLLQRNIFRQFTDQDQYATNLDITGKFDIGKTKHEVLAGFDFYRIFNNYGTDGQWVASNPALPINIYNPNPSYGIPQSTFDAAFLKSSSPGLNRSVIYNGWYGAYFQDQITLWDKLHIMGGGRYDWAETGRGTAGTFSDAANLVDGVTRKDEGFSPRVGILYQPWTQLGVYGNWTTSFGANNAPAVNGKTFAPQIGEQFEAGIKTQLFDKRFLATLAYYHLTKDNILVRDPNSPDPLARIANQQRSQGIELDMTGHVTEALSLIGSYAFTDARILKDYGGTTQGNRLNNVPEHSGSLWLKYDLNGYAALKGLSFGVGGVAAGQREGDNANSFQMPGYVRMDAFAAYKWNIKKTRVTTQLNIRNLLDKQYYASTDPNSNVAPNLGVYPGAPLTAIGSIRVEF
ncbi:MAG: TonB-dependent siderophore receptor [Methylobacter sp.]